MNACAGLQVFLAEAPPPSSTPPGHAMAGWQAQLKPCPPAWQVGKGVRCLWLASVQLGNWPPGVMSVCLPGNRQVGAGWVRHPNVPAPATRAGEGWEARGPTAGVQSCPGKVVCPGVSHPPSLSCLGVCPPGGREMGKVVGVVRAGGVCALGVNPALGAMEGRSPCLYRWGTWHRSSQPSSLGKSVLPKSALGGVCPATEPPSSSVLHGLGQGLPMLALPLGISCLKPPAMPLPRLPPQGLAFSCLPAPPLSPRKSSWEKGKPPLPH